MPATLQDWGQSVKTLLGVVVAALVLAITMETLPAFPSAPVSTATPAASPSEATITAAPAAAPSTATTVITPSAAPSHSTTMVTTAAAPNAPTVMSLDFEKVQKQLTKRGWTQIMVEDLVRNPASTRSVVDRRWPPHATEAVNEPATAYIAADGSYVVINNITGFVVQVSNRYDLNWKVPWED